jgi:hypothetical protein
MSQQVWFKDPAVLFSTDTWSQFVPMPNMSTAESLNAVVRFSVYFSVILFVATGIPTYLISIPAVLVASVVLFTIFPNGKTLESFIGKTGPKLSTKAETLPTAENPFMNPLLTEIQDNPNRPDAGPIGRSDVKLGIYKSFQKTSDLYMDTSDLFDQAKAMVSFHTLQSATIPNDQEGFLKWLSKNIDEPDYSSAPLARHGKKDSESYVKAQGSLANLPSSTSKPSGTTPTGSSLPASSK